MLGALLTDFAHNRQLAPNDDPAEDDDRISWAYAEARALLRDNIEAYDALRGSLETGGVTVGECCSLVERLA